MTWDAIYRTDGVSERHLGNPLIEALPPQLSPLEVIKAMANRPKLSFNESRSMSIQEREGELEVLEGLYVPPSVSVDLVAKIDTQIRKSYAGRNPLHVNSVSRMYDTASLLEAQRTHANTVEGMILLEGGTGSGKSRLVRTVLRRLPQGLRHHEYGASKLNFTQVVWISVHASIGGGVRSLLLEMLRGIDEAAGLSGTGMSYENSHKDTPVDRLVRVFGQAAATHHLGILHVDDVHRMAESTMGKKNTLQAIIQIANVVKCPVIFTGTPEGIAPLTSSSLELARRLTSAGALRIEHPASHEDKFFRTLVRAAIGYQWTDEILEPSEELYELLYRLSAGVTSIVLLLHKMAQARALATNSSVFTLNHYRFAYDNYLRPVHDALSALRKGGKEGHAAYESSIASIDKLFRERNGVAKEVVMDAFLKADQA